ncbi:MAG: 5'/3'-nucleotidase SurE [Candidatus Eiseniibacteriota bacterium]|nr:MAG: 5'/3'-nucleotidase SurE [Candidatus Eisenbacteria bacterium]
MILVTNDDGVHAEGLAALKQALSALGKVVAVAPDRERSATSHSLTLTDPLRVKKVEDSVLSVDGTPTDCVLLAVNGLLDERPELVVAGINHGPNLGEDVSYSGTVAAAIEGTLQGIPSIALSMTGKPPYHFDTACSFIVKLVRVLMQKGMDPQMLLNVNVPNLSAENISSVKVTKLGRRIYKDLIVKKVDPRGKTYYWIGGNEATWEGDESTDFGAIDAGMISVTPLHLDLTDYRRIVEMESWNLAP